MLGTEKPVLQGAIFSFVFPYVGDGCLLGRNLMEAALTLGLKQKQ